MLFEGTGCPDFGAMEVDDPKKIAATQKFASALAALVPSRNGQPGIVYAGWQSEKSSRLPGKGQLHATRKKLADSMCLVDFDVVPVTPCCLLPNLGLFLQFCCRGGIQVSTVYFGMLCVGKEDLGHRFFQLCAGS